DVDDALRGHVFAVQDSLFWASFIVAVAGTAAVVPPDGQAPWLIVVGTLLYLAGLAGHSLIGRQRDPVGGIQYGHGRN
ncbi:MFS transporter, partial [Mycobacterium kansasii]